MSNEKTEVYCPNCKHLAIKDGNKIICESCDSTFELKRTGGAKVVDVGRLDILEQRLERHAELLAGLFPEGRFLKNEPDPAKKEPSPAKVEDNLLG